MRNQQPIVGEAQSVHHERNTLYAPKHNCPLILNFHSPSPKQLPFGKGGEHVPDQIGYMLRNFNCLGVLHVIQTIKTAADACETLRFCLFLFLKQHCCINTHCLCFFCAKLLMMPFFAICPRASLKIHEWANWPDIL